MGDDRLSDLADAPDESAPGADRPPAVSVVTIFRNAPTGFFQEAIDSVLAQTETSWELLLVDDGSSDGSTEVARAAVARHPGRISLHAHPGGAHRGMSASRNLGIAAARGTFIAFLDADDIYLPEKLERQLAVLRRRPEVDVVFGPSLHWWSWSGDPTDATRDAARRLGVPPESVVRPPQLVRAYLERRADTPATCSVLVRRRAVAAVGGFEESFLDLYEDQAFFYKLLLVETAYVEGDAWDRYRRHPDSWCEVRIRAGEHADDYSATIPRRRFLEWLRGHLRETGVADRQIRRSVERELRPYEHPVQHRVATIFAAAAGSLQRRLRRRVRRIRSGLGDRRRLSAGSRGRAQR